MKNNIMSRAVSMLLILLFAGIAIVGPVSAAEEQSAGVCYCEYNSDSRGGAIDAYGTLGWNAGNTAILFSGTASTGSTSITCYQINVETELFRESSLVKSASTTTFGTYFAKASDSYSGGTGYTYRNEITARSWDPDGYDAATYVLYT